MAIIAGNVLRNTLLFIKEAEIVALPKWTPPCDRRSRFPGDRAGSSRHW